MAGGDEAAASADKHASTREDQLKLWTAGITLAGVLAGFIATGVQLFFQRGDIQRQSQDLQRLSQDLQRQSQDLQGIEQNFRNLSALKKALTKPLEGLWNFDVKYTKYFGKPTPETTLRGRAVFLWYGDPPNPGYHAYIGGGIKQENNPEPIVTLVIEFFLATGNSGWPKKGCAVHGTYLARTTSNLNFWKPSDANVEFKDGKFTENPEDHTITEMKFTFTANDQDHRTEATVTFARPRPEL